jgi:hypothetical protein
MTIKGERRTITLPSGATVLIRPVREGDYLSTGLLPLVLQLRKNGTADSRRERELTETDLKVQRQVDRMILCECTAHYRVGNRRLRIVDKHFGDEAEDELVIEDLPPADAKAILAAVKQLSGLDEEAAAAAAPFPAQQESTPAPGSAGPEIPLPADGSVAAAG